MVDSVEKIIQTQGKRQTDVLPVVTRNKHASKSVLSFTAIQANFTDAATVHDA